MSTVQRVYFTNPDGTLGYEDFHKDYGLFDRDGRLVVTEGEWGNGDVIAQFPSMGWLYHRIVVLRNEPKPLKQYLIYCKDDDFIIARTNNLEIVTREVRYTNDYQVECNISMWGWVAIFEFNEYGYKVIGINDMQLDLDTLVKAYEQANAHVIEEIKTASIAQIATQEMFVKWTKGE